MAQPDRGDDESPPAAAQVGDSDDGSDVGRKMAEVVHLLAKLKESVTELGEDVARIKADAKDIIGGKNQAGAKRAAGKDSMGRKIWRYLIKPAAIGVTAISGLGVIFVSVSTASAWLVVRVLLEGITTGKK